jgi:hypothetical protein
MWSLPFSISCHSSIFISKLAVCSTCPTYLILPCFITIQNNIKISLDLHIVVWNYVHLLSWYAVCIPFLQCPRYHITGLENHYIISPWAE